MKKGSSSGRGKKRGPRGKGGGGPLGELASVASFLTAQKEILAGGLTAEQEAAARLVMKVGGQEGWPGGGWAHGDSLVLAGPPWAAATPSYTEFDRRGI
jgi:hypothetical protein